MNKKVKKCLEIVKRFKAGENVSFDDVCTLAYTDISELETEEWLSVEDVLMSILCTYGKDWSEYDDRFPNNTYRFGHVLEDHLFITGYTGVAGRYWMESTGALCE